MNMRNFVLGFALLILAMGSVNAQSLVDDGFVPMTPENVDQIQQVAEFEQETVCTAIFSPDSERLAITGFNQVTLWNIEDESAVQTLVTEYRWVYRVAFSPDNTLIAATSAGSSDKTTEVRIWDTMTGDLKLQLLDDFEYMATALAFSPDGTKLVVGTGDVFERAGSSFVKLWDLTSETWLWEVPVSSYVTDVAFSPDGTLLAVAGHDSIALLDIETGDARTVLGDDFDMVFRLAFSPDGTMLAFGEIGIDGRLGEAGVWKLPAGELLYHLENITPYGITGMTFSTDGQLLVTGDGDKSLTFWDAATGEALAHREVGLEGAVYSVAFNADSTLLATCGHDQMLRLWRVVEK